MRFARLLLAAVALAPAAASADHPVYNLVDNRLLAHVQRGGGVVAIAGSAGFAKYLNGGRPNLPWKLGQTVDGKKVAISDGYARVTLPVADEQAPAATALWLRVSSPRPRELEVKLNGKRAAQVPVAAGWQTLKVPLEAGAVTAGEIEVQLVWSKKGDNPAVEWIQLGGETAADAAPVWWDRAGKALVLPNGGGLAYYVQVPAAGKLVASVDGAGCEVGVRARAAGQKPVDGVLRGAGAAVDLAALAGKVVRLDLVGRGCPEARVASAALLTGGTAPAAVAKPSKPKNVVFWVMDSLRADRVRPWMKGARAEVPNWEKLAQSSTVFLNAYVQGNESRVSHASLWSGAYPAAHRMLGPKDVLGKEWVTVGEVGKAAGMYTTGVSTNGWIVAKWGFGEGWDAYRNHIHEGGGTKGEDIWREAQKSLAPRLAKPWFLYMGTVDTHVSWRAHEPWISRYDTEPYTGPFKKVASDPDVDKIAVGKMKITERDKVRIVALYDSDISYQDDLMGKIVARLGEWGVAGDTMIVVVADHGEEFWEDGRLGHGGSLHETLVRVPMMIHYPPLFPAGVVSEGVDSLDLLPTIADALGVPASPEWQGESLIGLAQGVGRGYPRPSFASQYEDAHAMRVGDWKAILKSGGALRVYDVAHDYLEKNDLAAARPIERRFVTDALATFLAYQKRWKKTRWGVASNHSAAFAADVER